MSRVPPKQFPLEPIALYPPLSYKTCSAPSSDALEALEKIREASVHLRTLHLTVLRLYLQIPDVHVRHHFIRHADLVIKALWLKLASQIRRIQLEDESRLKEQTGKHSSLPSSCETERDARNV